MSSQKSYYEWREIIMIMGKGVSVDGEYFDTKREAAQHICDKLGRPNKGYGFEKRLHKKEDIIEGFHITYHDDEKSK
jgi:hypothetical protein